ncbi:hypothetical protein VPH35_023276 [Triticum aestivum]
MHEEASPRRWVAADPVMLLLNSPSSCYRGRLHPDLLTPVRMATPAAGSACRSRRRKRTEHVLAAEDALSLPRNACLARRHGQEGVFLYVIGKRWWKVTTEVFLLLRQATKWSIFQKDLFCT